MKYSVHVLAILILISVFMWGVVTVIGHINTTNNQIVAVAEDLGCTFVEQSYYHPERFYIDCGEGNIQILTLEKK
jgi:hypothetical protein